MVILILAIVAAAGLVVLLRPWPFFLTSEPASVNERNVAAEFGKWVEKRARAHGLKVRGVARPVPLECPKCGKSSNYFVYPDELCERCWRASLPRGNAPAEHQPRL